MKKNNISSMGSAPTVMAIAALSSCLMLGAVGAYRLTAGDKLRHGEETEAERLSTDSAADSEDQLTPRSPQA